jgi:hypothetical protein
VGCGTKISALGPKVKYGRRLPFEPVGQRRRKTTVGPTTADPRSMRRLPSSNQYGERPPDKSNTAPVEKLHCVPHNQDTNAATSSVSMKRPSGMRDSKSARRSALIDLSMFVRTTVGADQASASFRRRARHQCGTE